MAGNWPPKVRFPTPVEHWLGLGHTEPEGLHGSRRRNLVKRHTTLESGYSIFQALVQTYDATREVAIMRLLRQRHLDDALWRNVYALMVTASPVDLAGLIQFLTNLTSSDRKAADQEAKRHMRAWYAAHKRSTHDE